MSEFYKEKIGIQKEHELVQTETKWENRKGLDTDTYWFNELDTDSNIIAKYIVRDSTSIYPPQKRTISWDKIDS